MALRSALTAAEADRVVAQQAMGIPETRRTARARRAPSATSSARPAAQLLATAAAAGRRAAWRDTRAPLGLLVHRRRGIEQQPDEGLDLLRRQRARGAAARHL